MSIPLREEIVIGRPHWIASIAWLSFSVVGKIQVHRRRCEDDSANEHFPPRPKLEESNATTWVIVLGSWNDYPHGHLVGLLALISSRHGSPQLDRTVFSSQDAALALILSGDTKQLC